MEAVSYGKAWELLERWAVRGHLWAVHQLEGQEPIWTLVCHGKRGSLSRAGGEWDGQEEEESACLIMDGCRLRLSSGDPYRAVYDGEAGSVEVKHGSCILTFHARER